jgi:hypothetical protein
MHWYDIVSRILVILSIIDFALATPVLVQEKRQAGVDVVHIHKDVVPVLGKRGYVELDKLLAEYYKTSEKPIGSSSAHTLSSSVSWPDHGSTSAGKVPAPMQGLSDWDRVNAPWNDLWWYKPEAHVPQPNPNPRSVG